MISTCSYSCLCENIAAIDFLEYLLHVVHLFVFILISLETQLTMKSAAFLFNIRNNLGPSVAPKLPPHCVSYLAAPPTIQDS